MYFCVCENYAVVVCRVRCVYFCVKIMLAWLGVHVCISVCVKIVLDLSRI